MEEERVDWLPYQTICSRQPSPVCEYNKKSSWGRNQWKFILHKTAWIQDTHNMDSHIMEVLCSPKSRNRHKRWSRSRGWKWRQFAAIPVVHQSAEHTNHPCAVWNWIRWRSWGEDLFSIHALLCIYISFWVSSSIMHTFQDHKYPWQPVPEVEAWGEQ